MRVALFITCFNDTFFPQTGVAVVRLLERLGHSVEFPEGQTCCGQLHYNTGYRRDALRLARRFGRVFGRHDLVVAPSASCVGMVRHEYPRLDPALAELGPRVLELSELLVGRFGVEDVGATYPHRVTYHPTCHSLRVLGVGDAPLRLLRAVRGLELVELPGAEECCGFGGTFALKNAETSAAILADKVESVLSTGAGVCSAGDNSCLAHIGGGLARRGGAVRAVHLAEILAAEAT